MGIPLRLEYHLGPSSAKTVGRTAAASTTTSVTEPILFGVKGSLRRDWRQALNGQYDRDAQA